MSVLEAGWAVQRRPDGEGQLIFTLNGMIDYAIVEIEQTEMNRTINPWMGEGYPFCWCERGEDWIQVYPAPHCDLDCHFVGGGGRNERAGRGIVGTAPAP
jgi:hypothetical protein